MSLPELRWPYMVNPEKALEPIDTTARKKFKTNYYTRGILKSAAPRRQAAGLIALDCSPSARLMKKMLAAVRVSIIAPGT